jgi:hypothetical protein
LTLTAFLLLACSQQDKTAGVAVPASQDAASGAAMERNVASLNEGQGGVAAQGLQWTIELSPVRPGASDVIRVVSKTGGTLPSDIVYKYEWTVNRQVIKNATGDSLSNEYFRRKDVVRVNVSASAAGMATDYRSISAVIAGSSPLLEIKVISSGPKGPVIMQLEGKDPDGGKLDYALEPPVPEGMDMDSAAGTIRWVRPADFFGNLSFKISATNTDGEKFVKLFELSVSDKPVTVRSGSN